MKSGVDYLYMSKLSDQTERYEDMIKYITKSIEEYKELNLGITDEQRNLLSMAFKNVVNNGRTTYRSIIGLENTENEENIKNKKILKWYKEKLQKYIEFNCWKLIDILGEKPKIDNTNIKKEADDKKKNNFIYEPLIFHLKISADYNRYLCEFTQGDKLKKYINKADKDYKEAINYAKEHLPAQHLLKLGIALNYSVFLFEIKDSPEDAYQESKQAFEESLEELTTIKDPNYKDSTTVMQLLEENMNYWLEEINKRKNN